VTLGVAVLATAGAVALAPAAGAQDEPIEPAGELPEDDAGGAEPTLPPETDVNGNAPLDAMTEDPGASETWESYSDVGGTSVAQEVTKGIRVEDIVEPPSDYRYAAFGKPDPFVPPLLAADDIAAPEALEIPILSPLQRCGLNDMATSLVGIWQMPSGERKAMIMVPNACYPPTTGNGRNPNVGVVIRTGDPIGNRGGKVLGIGRDYLIVREFTLAPDGTRQYDDRQIYLGGQASEEPPAKLRFQPGSTTPEVIYEQTDRAVVGGGAGAPTSLGAPAARPERRRAELQSNGADASKAGQSMNGGNAASDVAPPPASGVQTTPNVVPAGSSVAPPAGAVPATAVPAVAPGAPAGGAPAAPAAPAAPVNPLGVTP
jgi:hypothetical protein